MHPLLETLFHSWEEADVCWCLLRRPAQPAAPTGDVDVLVARADARRVILTAQALGFHRVAGWGYGSDAFLLGRSPRDGVWLWLHLTFELRFGPYQELRTGFETTCLAHRRRDENTWVLAPEDAFWTLLLHCLLDKGHIAQRHRESLRALATCRCFEVGDRWPELLAPLFPLGWNVDRVLTAVLASRWGDLDQLSISLANECVRRHDPYGALTVSRRAARLAARTGNLVHPTLWRRFLSRRKAGSPFRAWISGD